MLIVKIIKRLLKYIHSIRTLFYLLINIYICRIYNYLKTTEFIDLTTASYHI